MKKVKLRVGGVPEYFNLPLHLAIESGEFEKSSLDVDWIRFDGGTGTMTEALEEGVADLCIILTEGIIKYIINGGQSKLISLHVSSPLCWGIHTGYKNSLKDYRNIFDKKYAISRFGSGSHLMAMVDANSNGKKIKSTQFVPLKNLDNALESLEKCETDVFYWEKYTTKPYVDSGQLRRIGEYLTPWPCFVIAASDRIIEAHPDALKLFLKVLHQSNAKFMNDDMSVEMISNRYDLDWKDAEKGFHSTEWATNGWINDKMIKNVVYNLKLAGIIKEGIEIPALVWVRQ
jgi:ABC-type nitrate/sulfonate/bicarbonate transport system substrate-binding protein